MLLTIRLYVPWSALPGRGLVIFLGSMSTMATCSAHCCFSYVLDVFCYPICLCLRAAVIVTQEQNCQSVSPPQDPTQNLIIIKMGSKCPRNSKRSRFTAERIYGFPGHIAVTDYTNPQHELSGNTMVLAIWTVISASSLGAPKNFVVGILRLLNHPLPTHQDFHFH